MLNRIAKLVGRSYEILSEVRRVPTTEGDVEAPLRLAKGLEIDDGLVALRVAEHLGRRAVRQAELRVRPDRRDLLRDVFRANTRTPALAYPVRAALNTERVEYAVHRVNEVVHLLDGVSGGRGNAQALLADRDSGVVDALDIDTMVDEE